MVSAKCLAVLLLAAMVKAEEITYVAHVTGTDDNARQEVPAVPTLPPMEHWSDQVRVAAAGATERFSQNMVTVLGSLAETSRQAGLNNTRAFATMIRAITTSTVDLTGVVAYMPRLFLLDLPNQFTEVLRLVRRNEVRVPSSVNEAIDSILVLTRQAEESGITNRIFGPIVRFLPNIFNGTHNFLQQIFTTMFTVFGTGTPLPEAPLNPIPSRSENEDNSTTTASIVVESTAAPAARYYRY
ncbi:hypothetical protein Ocin01_05452 [Orchesella cincta]|uniref:Uncharacterized protein n=1 Tax=Orchesella cincta TaxID=48709 RepID=A0A1D2N7J1_ORCCI|nr:hypothetical protein Ocin01_05452 [Orchesella cincta]